MVTQWDFLASDYESIQSEDIKYVWYFQLILEHKVGKCMLPSIWNLFKL